MGEKIINDGVDVVFRLFQSYAKQASHKTK